MEKNKEIIEIAEADKTVKKILASYSKRDPSNMMQLKSKNFPRVFLVLLVITGGLFLMNIAFGTVYIPIDRVIKALLGRADQVSDSIIIVESRLPRAVVGMFVGITVSLSGAIIKAVMRNPLADTGLLGIQTGATAVALLIILVFPAFYYLLPLAAFAGGLVAYIILMSLAYNNGFKPIRVVLSGVAVNAFFGALIGLIQIFNADRIGSALSWLNGSLARDLNHEDMYLMLVYGSLCMVIGFLLIPKCNLLLLDDYTISNLGFDVNRIRFFVATASVFIVSISVSVVGVIGFVGLVCPHIARLLVGNNYKHLVPTSMLLGASLVMLADLGQRLLFAPLEIPVGIVIAFLGAPFFLYLMRKQEV